VTSFKSYRADSLLLLTAMIWGFAFVAQRSGMQFIGPFAYTGVRYALGALAILPLWLFYRSRRTGLEKRLPRARRFLAIMVAGLLMFGGSALQQVGLVTTTAANAGFITCFYVVLVPIVGIFVGKPASWRVWVGAVLCLAGLYFLSVGEGFSVSTGDILVLACAFVWTGHILWINRVASRMDALEIAVGQAVVCAVLSLATALAVEPTPFAGLGAAAIPILYGGIMSIGVGFTLQVVAQKTAHPASASIIMSMESLFAAVGGVLILGEPLTQRLALGGTVMLAGMVIAQLELPARKAGAGEEAGAAAEPRT
jgi:drug/metabolite transporter (DMT)-like permease